MRSTFLYEEKVEKRLGICTLLLRKMQEKQKIILIWYKRDLRISDHRPLTEGLSRWKSQYVPVIALYSFEPRVTSAPDFSPFHRQFIEDALLELRDSLESIGIPLLIFERNISDVMKHILENYDIVHIYSHEETGNALTYDRDIMMGKYLRSKWIWWTEYPTNGVVRRLRSRDNWSKIWEQRMRESILPPPVWQEPIITSLISDPWQTDLSNPHIQKWWEKVWQRLFATFLLARGKGYMGGMSRPIEWQEASSRISPYLAYGCLSLRQVVTLTQIRMYELKEKWDSSFLRSLQAFYSRLHWQSHFIQKLESEPRFETENAMRLYDSIRTEYDETLMTAIETARTGIPFIDGIIRQLEAIGWINFRARATLVSFVCCTCMQPWQGRWAHWLARHFTDYEPGIHYMQLQMQAGTTGINTIRIYNPVKQLYDKDSNGRFVDTYLPELARLPKHLQAEPWKISAMESIEYDFVLGRDYPHPIVDVETANRRAREVLYGLKKSLSHEDREHMVEKHASRKTSPRKTPKKWKIQKIDSNLSLFD